MSDILYLIVVVTTPVLSHVVSAKESNDLALWCALLPYMIFPLKIDTYSSVSVVLFVGSMVAYVCSGVQSIFVTRHTTRNVCVCAYRTGCSQRVDCGAELMMMAGDVSQSQTPTITIPNRVGIFQYGDVR